MKTKLLIFVLVMFLVIGFPLVSSLSKSYDADQKKVTIKNTFLGIPTTTVAELTLDSPLRNKVPIGKDVLVAQFTVDSRSSRSNVFNSMQFYEIGKGMREIQREFRYKKLIFKNVTVEDVKYDCPQDNASKSARCQRVVVGTHQEQVSEWVPMTRSDFKDNEKVTIGIFTEVKKNDYVEWIPTFYGKRIPEWASWNSDLTAGLVAYYKFDLSSGDVLDSWGSNNATNSGADRGVTGKINTSFSYDGSSDFVNNSVLFTNGQNFSITYWANTNTTTGGHNAFSNRDFDNDRSLIVTGISGNKASFIVRETDNTDEQVLLSTNTLSTGTWYLIAITYNNHTKNMSLYLNGQIEASAIWSGTNNFANDISTIGASYPWSQYWNGYIDEMAIWNRSIVGSEIQDVYNGGSGLPFIPVNNASLNIELESPQNTAQIINTPISFRVNVTSAIGVSNVTLYIDNVGVSTNTSGVNGSYVFPYTPSNGDHTWKIEAYDILDQPLNSSVRSFTLAQAFLVGESYTTPVLEGQTTVFTANFTTNGSVISIANLSYNGTQQLATINSINSSFYTVTKTVAVPSVSANTNVSFYWNITFSAGNTLNFTAKNQTITNVAMDDCSVYTNILYNFTQRDEETQNILNATYENTSIEIELNLYSVDRSINVLNFSQNYTEVNPAQICLSSAIASSTVYVADVLIRYDADDYSAEFYNLQNSTFQNSSFPQNINLYDLALADSTEFLVTFKGSNLIPVDNALIHITRKYITEGVFKTVEIPKTDSDGQAITHLDLDSVIYTIVVTKNGEVLATFSNVAVVCADESIGDCKINLNALSSDTTFADFATEEGVSYSMSFNETSRTITATFTSTDGSIKTMTLGAVKFDQYENETVCLDTLASSSGTLTCVIPGSYGNVSVIAELYAGSSLITTETYTISSSASSSWGSTGFIFIFILILILPLIALDSGSGVMMMVMLIVGIILAGLLVFMESGSLLGTGSALIWLVIAIGIIIYKGGERERGI